MQGKGQTTSSQLQRNIRFHLTAFLYFTLCTLIVQCVLVHILNEKAFMVVLSIPDQQGFPLFLLSVIHTPSSSFFRDSLFSGVNSFNSLLKHWHPYHYRTVKLFLFRLSLKLATGEWEQKKQESSTAMEHWGYPKVIILPSTVTLCQKIPEENINASEDKSPTGLG